MCVEMWYMIFDLWYIWSVVYLMYIMSWFDMIGMLGQYLLPRLAARFFCNTAVAALPLPPNVCRLHRLLLYDTYYDTLCIQVHAILPCKAWPARNSVRYGWLEPIERCSISSAHHKYCNKQSGILLHTLWWFNIAIENDHWFSIMFVYQRVNLDQSWRKKEKHSHGWGI